MRCATTCSRKANSWVSIPESRFRHFVRGARGFPRALFFPITASALWWRKRSCFGTRRSPANSRGHRRWPGIGRAIAHNFTTGGYALCTADEDAEAACATRRAHPRGHSAPALPATITGESEAARSMAQIAAKFAAPDVPINNARIACNYPLFKLALADFDRVVAVHVGGAFLCAQMAARAMNNAGMHGVIVNSTPTGAFMSEAGTEAYSAPKGHPRARPRHRDQSRPSPYPHQLHRPGLDRRGN
jgi:short chain dehydrogenase